MVGNMPHKDSNRAVSMLQIGALSPVQREENIT